MSKKTTSRKGYYQKNRNKIIAYKKAYYQKHKIEICNKSKLYRQKNAEKIANYQLVYYKINKNKLKKYRNKNRKKISKYEILRYHLNINFRLCKNLRNRLYSLIRGKYKSGSAICDLDCTINEFKIYIENKFLPGMTWENYGNKKGIKCWHLDHIKPLSKFDLTNRKQLLKACYYTNIQPLWAEDNLRKRNKYY